MPWPAIPSPCIGTCRLDASGTCEGCLRTTAVRHDLSPRQVDLLLAGGVVNWLRKRLAA